MYNIEGAFIPTINGTKDSETTKVTTPPTENGFQKAIQIALFIFIPIALFFSFVMPVLPEDILSPYSDYGSTVLNAIAVSLGIVAVLVYSKGEFQTVGLSITLYLFLYMLASIIWDIYDQVLQVNPFPSAADVFWLAAYVPLTYICVSTLIKYHEYSNPSRTLILYMVMFFVAILIFVPLATSIINTDSSMGDKALTLAYPVLDLFLLILIGQLVGIYWTGKLAVYWTFIMTAIIFELSADIIYTYMENYDIYYPGSLSDSFFFMASFFFIFVFFTVILAKRYSAIYGLEPEGKYDIRHVFLVYPNGLLIAHLTTPGTKIVDVEIFTGMLTAVQSFIKESFQLGESSGGLDRLRYKSLEIAIERGENVFLAVVVDGRVTDQLHKKMHAVIDHVQQRYGPKLKNWDGDMAHVAGVKDVVGEVFAA